MSTLSPKYIMDQMLFMSNKNDLGAKAIKIVKPITTDKGVLYVVFSGGRILENIAEADIYSTRSDAMKASIVEMTTSIENIRARLLKCPELKADEHIQQNIISISSNIESVKLWISRDLDNCKSTLETSLESKHISKILDIHRKLGDKKAEDLYEELFSHSKG